MEPIELLVVLAGVLTAGFLAWFFFGPKQARRAELVGGVQEVHVTVKGGYSPDLIRKTYLLDLETRRGGGVYLWRSREAAAEAHGAAFRARINAAFGAEPAISVFETPLIVFQGLDDKVVPPNQSEMIVDALRSRGVECEYHAYEGEGHGFRRADTIVHQMNAELAFYRRVLGL